MKFFLIRLKQLTATILLGIPVTIWLLLRNTKTVYYIPHAGLGDYCIALGYLNAYKKRNHFSHVTLIVPPSRVEIAKLYPCWDSILVLPRFFYMGIVYFGSIPVGRFIHRRTKRIISVSFMMHLNKRMLYNNPSADADRLAKLILKLPENEKRNTPCVPDVDISDFISRFDLKMGKTVLLNPYTGGWAVKEIDSSFYTQLTKKLLEQGYAVATILGSDKQKPIRGTKGLVTSLSEAWHLARWCGWVIGTRSGFFDFIWFSGCNLITIYEESYKLRDMFALPEKKESCVKEYIWSPGIEEQLISNILSDLSIV